MIPNKAILLFMFILGSLGVNAQNVIQKDPSEDVESAARLTAEGWQRELAMTNKQTALMEDNIIEYALKRRKLLKLNLPDKEMAEQLVLLKLSEDKGLRDILTKPQFEMYLYIREQRLKKSNGRKNP